MAVTLFAESKPTKSGREDFQTSGSLRSDVIPGSRITLFGSRRLPKISQAEIVHLTTQLAIMLRSGVDLTSALESLARQVEQDQVKEVLLAIHDDVMSGRSFSEGLSRFEFIFGQSYVASVSAGEASGKMWPVLQQLANLRGNTLKLKQKVKTMMAYPIALTSISGIVVLALMFGVLPQFAKIFDTYDVELPLVTRVLLGFSSELTNRFWLWLPLFGLVLFAAMKLMVSEFGKRAWDQFVLDSFLLKDVSRSLLIGQTSRLLGLLIESGVPLLESLGLVRQSVSNRRYRKLFEDLEESVLIGNGLGNFLTQADFVPRSAAEMIMTAEKTGSIAGVTQLVGSHYAEQGEEKLRNLTAYLEPVITIVMGVVVATIVMAVALPMFDMVTLAK